MKLVSVNDLNGTEVLWKDILDYEGKVLLSAGTVLNKAHIEKLKNNGIYAIKVEDDYEFNLKWKFKDEYMNTLKTSVIKNMPILFDNLVDGDYDNSYKYIEDVYSIVDHIIHQGSITTNLFQIKSYDEYTYVHCVDTCIMATFLGYSMNINKANLRNLAVAALLHDIGKTKIPTSIINKKSKLSNNEFEIIKKHPMYGKQILQSMKKIHPDIISGVAEHHERFDGKGYPFGIKGYNICKFARIISICDVFTAVSANRSYRERFSPTDAYELILSCSGTAFDPTLVEHFRKTFFVYPLGCRLKLSNGLEGIVIEQNKFFPDRPIVRIISPDSTVQSNPFDMDLLKETTLTVVQVFDD
ncbi:HD-GYP domain-containing protein [Hathewaya massiliensis]|uniref:HD-GYP domain-containing protein n=1 Tax=Hathewaya massiliensis TaxID=1964382 RepID=UPI00115A3A96|nr:HD-GYP domain-containing protein [Hathewaya massiliensis]